MRKSIFYSILTLFVAAACTNSNDEKQVPDSASADQKVVKVTEASVYVTAKDTDLKLSAVGQFKFAEIGQPLETQPFVLIDPAKTFQTMEGIGAALSDAAAETFYKMPKDVQQQLLSAFYDKDEGIGYNFARTNIASCDFSSGSYNYVEENDAELKTFSVAHDEKYRIPFIKEAFNAADGKIKLFVSPWSPPAWMKDNNNVLKGGKLLDEYNQSWANYYIKFIQEYEKHGIPIWGLSVQNEPMAVQKWESCVYSATEERDFIKNYLGPALHNNGMSEKKLIAWDHNRDQVYQRATTILSDPDAAKYVWGIGFHWYEPWTGGDMQFENLKLVNDAFPETKLVFTEGCIEKYDAERVTEWWLGERYGYSMLHDFNNGTVAWTDWNVFLDENGGPNHVGNFCYAPAHANTQTGEVVFTNSYYYIGHFSKFIKAGAKRIAASSSRTDLESTAFINPDGSLAVVVLNRSEEEFNYSLMLNGKATVLKSLPRSIMTIIL
ncbi:glucosylceramidase [Draconibacterium orientale]|uniref:Glucosylceramidase n=1 Tax=Draconibacterium orientale TaxID=1168034 RepID=X5DZF2_9BACT|nr:glycoside hydrolase family 30 protein [Draconibacterium orientale]AHW60620.1 glycosyl hydrolase [Draconibacterium orientale]SET05523.1 glucosylceramidase [Draconibacterium orientale]